MADRLARYACLTCSTDGPGTLVVLQDYVAALGHLKTYRDHFLVVEQYPIAYMHPFEEVKEPDG